MLYCSITVILFCKFCADSMYNGYFYDDSPLTASRLLSRSFNVPSLTGYSTNRHANDLSLITFAKWTDTIIAIRKNKTTDNARACTKEFIKYIETNSVHNVDSNWRSLFEHIMIRGGTFDFNETAIKQANLWTSHALSIYRPITLISDCKEKSLSSILVNGNSVEFVFGDKKCTMPFQLLSDAIRGGTADSISGCMNTRQFFLVLYNKYGSPGVIVSYDHIDNKLIWKKHLFSCNTRNTKLSEGHVHYIVPVADDHAVSIYGCTRKVMYIESYICCSGATRLKFSTNYYGSYNIP